MNGRVRTLDPSVLARTLDRARGSSGKSVVVFDLDSTLLDNRPRQAVILREFGVARGLAPLAATRPDHWDSWDIKRAMRNAGLPEHDIAAIAEEAKAFWRERFFTSRYCRLDDAIRGAARFVREVSDAGALVVYCTGRHEEMRAGSVESFERLGFPVPGARVHLLMKPTSEQNDDDWKTQAYARLRQLGTVVAAFDNEPTHINGYRAGFPDAFAVHIATDDSDRDVLLLDGVVSIPHFDV
jgi:predicted secreted acid phosphatase